MGSWGSTFVLFGALIVWAAKLFKGRYEELLSDDKEYFNFFIGLGTFVALIIVIGRVIELHSSV